jgi:GNAT superfamily N-acetyltransferase
LFNWYSKDFVAKIGQFAVEPELQKYGIGSKMMDIVEEEARRIKNVRELALDTAETAHHLKKLMKNVLNYAEYIKYAIDNSKLMNSILYT